MVPRLRKRRNLEEHKVDMFSDDFYSLKNSIIQYVKERIQSLDATNIYNLKKGTWDIEFLPNETYGFLIDTQGEDYQIKALVDSGSGTEYYEGTGFEEFKVDFDSILDSFYS